MHTWTTHFLTLTSLAVALGVNHAPTNPLRRSEECVTKALALRNLTALAPQIVLDSAIPENNAVVFQLFNPVTQVSGECAAHGDTLSPDALTGRPDIWYNCFVESRDPTITVEFQFDSSLNRLTVNETWTCADDEDDLVRLQAFGAQNLTFTCSEQGSQRLCLEDGDVYIDVNVSTVAS